MYDMFPGGKTGGLKYRDHIHDFKASVFGYALSGVIAMVVIHSVVLSSPAGHAKWATVFGQPAVTTSK
jgi:hypothetical protein